MTAPVVPDLPSPPRNELSRLTGVVMDPQPAFADIAARPRWWPPLLLLVASSVIYLSLFSHRVGWERFMRQQLETSSRSQNLTEEQREQALAKMTQFAPVMGYVGTVVGISASALVVSAVLLFVCGTLMGAGLKFRQFLAITCYSFMPGVIGVLTAIMVLFLKNPDEFNLQNPTAFNLGAFLDPVSSPKWMVSLAGSLDLFTIWTILLIATGISVAARNLRWHKALLGVVAPWIIWVLLKAGWAAIFA